MREPVWRLVPTVTALETTMLEATIGAAAILAQPSLTELKQQEKRSAARRHQLAGAEPGQQAEMERAAQETKGSLLTNRNRVQIKSSTLFRITLY